MSFDLNILCFNQRKSSTDILFQSSFLFDLHHEKADAVHKYYGNTWPFMNHCPGFWYYLFPADEALEPFLSGCYNMCEFYSVEREPELELGDSITNRAEWREYVESLGILEIKREFRADFEKVIDFFLDESPSKTILFLARCQGLEEDVIQGSYPRDIFFEMLDDYHVRFNTCYIICKESQARWSRFIVEDFGDSDIVDTGLNINDEAVREIIKDLPKPETMRPNRR